MKIAHLKKCIGPIIVGIALAWMVAAPWLSAHRLISVAVEMDGYFRWLLVLIGGLFIYDWLANDSGYRRVIRFGISTLAIMFSLYAWLISFANFAHWKLAAISNAEWGQMSSDLEKLANDLSHGSTNFQSLKLAELPQSVQILGRPEDLWRASYEQAAVSGEDNAGPVITIMFGQPRCRCWGIHVGPEAGGDPWFFLHCRKVDVATNAFFFIGVYD